MVSFEFSVDIDRQPSEVFAYVTDPARLSEWQPDLVAAVASGAMAPGTTIREVRRFLGRRLEIEQEVTEFDPGRRLALKAASGPFPLAATIDFEPRGTGTRVRFRGEAGDPGTFFGLAEPVVARLAERQVRNRFRTAKDILEAGGGGGAGAPGAAT